MDIIRSGKPSCLTDLHNRTAHAHASILQVPPGILPLFRSTQSSRVTSGPKNGRVTKPDRTHSCTKSKCVSTRSFQNKQCCIQPQALLVPLHSAGGAILRTLSASLLFKKQHRKMVWVVPYTMESVAPPHELQLISAVLSTREQLARHSRQISVRGEG